MIVKLIVQVKLLPTPEQAAALEATLHACNEAATWASRVAFDKDVKRNFALRETPTARSNPGGTWGRRPPNM